MNCKLVSYISLFFSYRSYVPEVVCLLSSLPHSIGWVSVFLHPGENELSLHQLLSHIPLQRTAPEEEGQFSSDAEGRPTERPPRLRSGSVANALLN